ncbi:jg12510 [Pararge aegeria aegeria]|uniref:Jg12510 protein n=1 Tax=Pararge aegeria aegeria TaxID=348720 RepID=A0A8S4R2T6_9NEOP|nr:jg12510 [Pararge aegeria aegeria]
MWRGGAGCGDEGRGVRRSDVTYKVATHRRAVNAARAYCLRSRDEPFSRARRAAARLTGRGAVNRTLGGGSGGNR